MERLTLAEALATDRLDDFVEQAEAEGIGPADRHRFVDEGSEEEIMASIVAELVRFYDRDGAPRIPEEPA